MIGNNLFLITSHKLIHLILRIKIMVCCFGFYKCRIFLSTIFHFNDLNKENPTIYSCTVFYIITYFIFQEKREPVTCATKGVKVERSAHQLVIGKKPWIFYPYWPLLLCLNKLASFFILSQWICLIIIYGYDPITFTPYILSYFLLSRSFNLLHLNP